MAGKTGTTESHRSSAFLGFTNQYAAANYIFDDTPAPSGVVLMAAAQVLQRQSVRRQRTRTHLVQLPMQADRR